MRKIKWSYLAQEYFLSIRSNRIRSKVLTALDNAHRFPKMYPASKSVRYPDARAIVIKPFVILYEFDEESLIVIAIYHQKRIY